MREKTSKTSKSSVERATPNHGLNKNPDEADNRKYEVNQRQKLTNTKVSKADMNAHTRFNTFIFRRDSEELRVRKELFIMEGDDGFTESSLRCKMTKVMKISSEEL
jgi:hypothetical protein